MRKNIIIMIINIVYYHPPPGHPPPGDFIALGAKGGGESKAPAVLLKPASTGTTADRKRETSTALPSSSGLSGLTKRPKLSTTPPVSALGRLAEVAAVDKRAISPSIKEPSVIPIEGTIGFLCLKGRYMNVTWRSPCI